MATVTVGLISWMHSQLTLTNISIQMVMESPMDMMNVQISMVIQLKMLKDAQISTEMDGPTRQKEPIGILVIQLNGLIQMAMAMETIH